MADDIPFANGRGPAPRRRIYASPFGALQNDAPDIQYGNGGMGPLPPRRMFAAPFGALQADTPPIQYGDGQTGPTQGINTLASSPPPQPIAQPFGMLPTAGFTSQPPPPPTPPAPLTWPPPPAAAFPADSIKALLRSARRLY